MAGPEVSAGIGAFIVAAAVLGGADPAELQARTGFDVTWASDADRRIALELETALWDEAARLTRDPAFGVRAAERARPGAFDVLDYAIRTAPTLRASLERLARYNRIVHDAAVIRLLDLGQTTRVEHSLGEARQSRHAAEFTLAAVVVVGRQMARTEPALRPLAAEFRHAPPERAAIDELVRVFGVEPRFDAPVNALAFARDDLDAPVADADPALSRVIERHAEALLALRPERAETACEQVRRLLATSLSEESGATLAAVAVKLGSSERSLQRRLSDEGTSFEALLDEQRRELSLRYLSDPKIAIAEIAYLLGYSEPSAFHRAFKRWTGKTPSQARERAA